MLFIPLVLLSAAPQHELDAIRQAGMADGVLNKGDLRTGLIPLLRNLVVAEPA